MNLYLAVILAAAAALLITLPGRRARKRLEAQLEEQERLLAQERQQRQADGAITALASAYTGVFGLDPDRDELHCYRSEEAAIVAGDIRSYRAWITEYAEKYVVEEDRPGFLRFTETQAVRAALAEEPTAAHCYLRVRDGAKCFEQLHFARAREGGEIGMAFGHVDRETQDALARQNTLEAALTEAERTNKFDLSFLSRMSHDIRTPLNAIIGLDSLALSDDTISEKSRDYLVKIGDSAQHLLALINEILDMSRIESGQISLRQEDFNFKAMLESLSAAAADQCRAKGLSYECNLLSPVDDYYCGDEARLNEVLGHLLDNAVKFTDPPGNVTLSVSSTAVFNDQTTLVFRIRDTGVGIEKERLDRLFDTFSRDSATESAQVRHGLGLAITRNLVELMDGSISVESEKGEGSEFTVTLTLKKCPQRAAEDETPIDINDLYVLVVDDNLNSARYTKSVLDRVGIRSDICTSGPDAIHMIDLQHGRNQPYQLVLMDCNMPDMDGLEATERIKAKYGSEITVVILTSYSWDDIAEEAKRVGVDSFLLKPLFPANVTEEFVRIARRNHITKVREQGRAELTGRKILLAEDMAINAEILMDILSMEDIGADHAENGAEAVEMFRNSAPGFYSAILMDVRMPVMDGLAATAAIRALNRDDAGTIPIIALTANAFDEDVKRSLQAGMNAHLCKPVDIAQLFQVMGELILDAEKTT